MPRLRTVALFSVATVALWWCYCTHLHGAANVGLATAAAIMHSMSSVYTLRYRLFPLTPESMHSSPPPLYLEATDPQPSPELLAFAAAVRLTRRGDRAYAKTLARNPPRFDPAELAEARGMGMISMQLVTGPVSLPAGVATQVAIAGNPQPSLLVAPPGCSNATGAPVILHMHGGGMAVGSALQHFGGLAFRMAQATGVRVLTLEYSLAPEHCVVDGAFQQAVNAYRYLTDVLQVPPAKIGLVGGSAGGYMVLKLLLELKARQLPLPACGVPITPMCDVSGSVMDTSGPSDRDFLLNRDVMRAFNQAVMDSCGLDGKDPRISPLFADFSSLPPLYFALAKGDPLFNEGLACMRKAVQAGVDVRGELMGSGLPHYYSFLDVGAPETLQAFGRAMGFLREHLLRITLNEQE